MKTIIVFLLFIAIAFAQKKNMTRALENEAIAALTHETENVIKQFASARATGLLSQVAGRVGSEFWTCEKKYLNESLRGFPQKIIEEFNNIMFSSSTEFESFSDKIETNYTYVDNFVGAAKANSTDVAVGITYVAAVGSIIQQYKTTRECHRCWLFGKCCKDVKTPIGFTSTQEDEMVDFVTEEGYKHLLTELQKMAIANNMHDSY